MFRRFHSSSSFSSLSFLEIPPISLLFLDPQSCPPTLFFFVLALDVNIATLQHLLQSLCFFLPSINVASTPHRKRPILSNLLSKVRSQPPTNFISEVFIFDLTWIRTKTRRDMIRKKTYSAQKQTHYCNEDPNQGSQETYPTSHKWDPDCCLTRYRFYH